MGGSNITADGDCSHEIKRYFFLWKKSYEQYRQHIKKQRCYFAKKGLSSQNYGFSGSQYGCESWTIKTAGDVGEDSLKSLGLQGDPSSPS